MGRQAQGIIQFIRDLFEHHLGRRGAALGFLATLDCLLAWSLWMYKLGTLTTPASYRLLFLMRPPGQWALLWLAVGLVCGIFAWKKKDSFAFSVAITIKLIWGLGILAAWIVDRIPNVWVGAIFWLTFSAFVAVVSGWPEPIPHPPPELIEQLERPSA